MNRKEIFQALNEDYPSVRTEVSSNPIGLFETANNPTVAKDDIVIDVLKPTLKEVSVEDINESEE